MCKVLLEKLHNFYSRGALWVDTNGKDLIIAACVFVQKAAPNEEEERGSSEQTHQSVDLRGSS